MRVGMRARPLRTSAPRACGGLLAAGFALALGPVAARAAEGERVEQLERRVERQEEVIEAQDRRLRELEARVEASEGRGDDTPEAAVTSGSPRVRLSISGQVHRAMNVVDDGDDVDVYHVDSDASNTRLRFSGEGEVSSDLVIVARIEAALSANNSGLVRQGAESGQDRVEIRIGEIQATSRRFGRISIGRGFSASDSSSEVDLSRTIVVSYAGFSNVVGGLRLFDEAAGTRTDVSLNAAFGNIDGLGRENRVTVETPVWRGLQLAAGANTNDRYDAAARWAGRGNGLRAAGAAGYARFAGNDARAHRWSGSFSVLHEATGLNATAASGYEERRTTGHALHLYGKLGWLADFFRVGPTAFGADYGRSVNAPTRQDDGHSIGGMVVQHFEAWGAEIYAQYRWLSLHRNGVDLAPVHAGSTGVRVKF